ncbi:MAG TPA: amidohydrolase family protein, partial [Acidimicrobiales bacterium]|nr:amidohydrolase family protein [Acidimicrobiales bacterium]
PTCFSAHDALELATCAGAEAIGMADRIGSIEVGKKADLVVFEHSSPHWSGDGDPALALVWATDGRHVRHVVVDGRIVVEEGRCLTVDETALVDEARRRSADLMARSGLRPPVRWPVVHGD